MNPDDPIEIASILYPTDFSELSGEALRYAEFLSRKLDAALHVLHVVDDSYQYWVPTEAVVTPVGPPVEDLQQAARKQLDALIADHFAGRTDVTTSVRPGRPFLEIIRYARENSVAMIVMGTHGRTGLKHVLMGSVAEKVVRKAPCPVVTVPSPSHHFEMP